MISLLYETLSQRIVTIHTRLWAPGQRLADLHICSLSTQPRPGQDRCWATWMKLLVLHMLLPFGSPSQTLLLLWFLSISIMATLPQSSRWIPGLMVSNLLRFRNLLRFPSLYICVVGKLHQDWAEPNQLGFGAHMQHKTIGRTRASN